MKRIFGLLLAGLIILSSCSNSDEDSTTSDHYYDMLDLLTDAHSFSVEPVYYDITVELAQIDGGYRYYVIVDNARIAMYNIQVMAIVVGEDYSATMAPNIGIFEGILYSMIPNQSNVDAGYVAGLSISGLTDEAEVTIDILVRYSTSDLQTTYRDYYRYTVSYVEEDTEDTETDEELESDQD